MTDGCFDGITSRSGCSAIVKEIEVDGGTYIDSIRRDLNYFVVGNDPNSCWVFSCHGRKMEQVMAYWKKESRIVIVHENNFWDAEFKNKSIGLLTIMLEETEMNLATLIATILTAIFTGVYCWITRQLLHKTITHQVLVEMHDYYSKPEMFDAVISLWNFYRKYKGKDLGNEYLKIKKEEEEWVQTFKQEEQIKALKSTLHYKRKLVSNFYKRLAEYHVNHVIPNNILFRNWDKDDLKIIRKVLFPIESAIRDTIKKGSYVKQKSNIWILYRDCICNTWKERKQKRVKNLFKQYMNTKY